MLTHFFLTSLLAFAPGATTGICIDGPVPVADETLRVLYEGGQSYKDFLAGADSRRELWHGNTSKSEGLDADLVRRARAVGGTWRFLVVAVASCSDSVSTVPYLARLASLVDGLDVRIVDSDAGRAVMEAHRTPDGRGATPTVVLLDRGWNEVGCFIERPMHLQDWISENSVKISRDDVFEGKMAWYAKDAGHETVSELVSMLEAASRGEAVCQGH